MIHITLPDGAIKDFAEPVSGADLAASIAPSLRKKAAAITVDGKVSDLSTPLARDAKVEILTREDPRALELIRHSAAHVLAEAVQELFPGAQATIGPVIEHGFFYDFAVERPFILAVGAQEAANGTVSLRRLGEKSSRSLTLGEAFLLLSAEAETPLEDGGKPAPTPVPETEPA